MTDAWKLYSKTSFPTVRQVQVLDFIEDYTADPANYYPPTVAEIGEHLGVTESTIRGHLYALKIKGFVDWEPYEWRTLRSLRKHEGGT